MTETVDKKSEPCPLDMEIFQQILDLDDGEDDDREFSKSMVWDFFEQVEVTFPDMEEKLQGKDLTELCHLGHFLKGSAATMGAVQLSSICEQIEYYGKLIDKKTDKPVGEEAALAGIEEALPDAKEEYQVVKDWLKKFFEAEVD